MGSMRAARRAGTYPATTPMAMSTKPLLIRGEHVNRNLPIANSQRPETVTLQILRIAKHALRKIPVDLDA
jgi:hypothetical protein